MHIVSIYNYGHSIKEAQYIHVVPIYNYGHGIKEAHHTCILGPSTTMGILLKKHIIHAYCVH